MPEAIILLTRKMRASAEMELFLEKNKPKVSKSAEFEAGVGGQDISAP